MSHDLTKAEISALEAAAMSRASQKRRYGPSRRLAVVRAWLIYAVFGAVRNNRCDMGAKEKP